MKVPAAPRGITPPAGHRPASTRAQVSFAAERPVKGVLPCPFPVHWCPFLSIFCPLRVHSALSKPIRISPLLCSRRHSVSPLPSGAGQKPGGMFFCAPAPAPLPPTSAPPPRFALTYPRSACYDSRVAHLPNRIPPDAPSPPGLFVAVPDPPAGLPAVCGPRLAPLTVCGPPGQRN